MFINRLVAFILIAFVSILFYGCGSGASSNGSTLVFQTASVTYSTSPVNAYFDPIITQSPTTDTSSIVTLTLTATTFPNVQPSNFTVSNLVVTYTRTDDASFVVTIPENGGTATNPIPITLVRSDVEQELINRGFSPGNTSWKFYVTATFTVVEDISNTSRQCTNIGLGQVLFH